MKRAYISIIILLLLILLSVLNYSVLTKASDNMLSHLEPACSSENAEEMLLASESFERSHNYLCSITYHSEIDRIRQSYVLSRAYLSIKDSDDFLAQITALISSVEHLKENESFSIHNIF